MPLARISAGRARVLIGLATLLSSGCFNAASQLPPLDAPREKSNPSSGPDADLAIDAGPESEPDIKPLDAGSAVEDARAVVEDAGASVEDAGALVEDASLQDAGIADVGTADTGSVSSDNSFSAPSLWAPIDLSLARDLGGHPAPLLLSQRSTSGRIQLTEVGERVGLANAAMGGRDSGTGVGFIDVNGDGFEDIFLANGKNGQRLWESRLYLNQTDGTFVDVTESSGIRTALRSRDCYSVAAADYDRDGDLDLYVTTHPYDVLLQNDGKGHFTNVTQESGAGGIRSSELNTLGRSKIAAWGDLDGDGFLDLAVASTAFVYPQRGYLLRNRGDGTFEDVTQEVRFKPSESGNPSAIMWSDFDNDGDQDIWVWSLDGVPDESRVLLRNDPAPTSVGRVFVDVHATLGVTDSHLAPMGIDGADINRDGWLDYFISDWASDNALYLGSSSGAFTEISASAGTQGVFGWGLGFEDFNADGWIDLFVAQEDDLPYLTLTHNRNIPPTFSQQEWTHSTIEGHTVPAAFADYDHDGRVDILTGNTGGTRAQLFRNETDLGTNHWLEVRIPEAPRTGERGGVSARVVVKTGALVQFRDINGGSSRGSQNATSARFGLGAWTGAEWVAALWPDGRQIAVRNVPANQILSLSN